VNTKRNTIDKDLDKIVSLENATKTVSSGLVAHTSAFIFLVAAGFLGAFFAGVETETTIVVFAAVLGGYMALNIGANDVANNVGPAVGSKAMSIFAALLMAAVFESAGALLAGGDVVSTISKGIIDPKLVPDNKIFINAMMAALLAAAIWVNFATIVGAPVSTTHSVVGGVMGAGIAAVGFQLVNWNTMVAIAASWVISPVLGGIIAASFLAFIKINLIYKEDKIAAANRWIPMLVAIMASAFACYLSVKGLKRVWKPELEIVALVGVITFVVVWLIMNPIIKRQSDGMENRNRSLRTLFKIPLICSAALLSFAHGANDVANAIGPLAAILHSVEMGTITAKALIPNWVMIIGAFGISLGLFLYGPKLIRMVGNQITKMNPMRAYCVALSAAITVIIASWLGLPVSSTHIAVGAVFGVGFYREYFTRNSKVRKKIVSKKTASDTVKKEKSIQRDMKYRRLVRRSHFLTIIAAWVITVPAAAILSALIFFGMAAIN
jgi:PiT family inorganic phosphate transporter